MTQEDEAVRELSGIVLFADLKRPELQAIDRIFEEEFFEEGRRILHQGIQGSNFYVIVDGKASVWVDGRERARLARGDCFGEMSLLLGDVPSADVIATSPLRCRTLSGGAFEDFLLSHPRVMYLMLQAEAMRLQAANRWRD